MLEIARMCAQKLRITADLRLGDLQALDFPDVCFDAAVGTFVFCSTPNPALGLRELGRVVRTGGTIPLPEHVRSENFVLGKLMDILNLMVVRLMGANINRRTVNNVRRL
jgi:ubiquinone/menaquinone biosynthesis C-methylase UbiE